MSTGLSFGHTTLSSAWSESVILTVPEGLSRNAIRAAMSASISAMRGPRDCRKRSPASVGATLRVVRVSSLRPMRSSRRLMVWLSVDCAIPSFAAALVKLRSLATTRNHNRSLKSAFATGVLDVSGRDLCPWSIDASELPHLILSIWRCYVRPYRESWQPCRTVVHLGHDFRRDAGQAARRLGRGAVHGALRLGSHRLGVHAGEPADADRGRSRHHRGAGRSGDLDLGHLR